MNKTYHVILKRHPYDGLFWMYGDSKFLCMEGVRKMFGVRAKEGQEAFLRVSSTPLSSSDKIIGLKKEADGHFYELSPGKWSDNSTCLLDNIIGTLLKGKIQTKYFCVRFSLTNLPRP